MTFCTVSHHLPPWPLQEAPWNAPEGPPLGLLLHLQWKGKWEDAWLYPVLVPGNPALVFHPKTRNGSPSLLWFNPRVKSPPFRSGQRLHVEGWGWERIPEPPPGDILNLVYDGQALTVDSVRVLGGEATWHVHRYRKQRGRWKLLHRSVHTLTTGPAQGTGQAASARKRAYAPGWVFFAQGRPEEGVLRVQAWSRREKDEAPFLAPAEEWHLPDWTSYLEKALGDIAGIETLLFLRAHPGPGGIALHWRVSIKTHSDQSLVTSVRTFRKAGSHGVLVMPHPEDVGLAEHDVYWLTPPGPTPWSVLLSPPDYRTLARQPSYHLTEVWLTHDWVQGLYPVPPPEQDIEREVFPPFLLSGNPLRMLWLERGGGEGCIAVLDTVEGNRLVRRVLAAAPAPDLLRPHRNALLSADVHPYFPIGVDNQGHIKEVFFWNPKAIEGLFEGAQVKTYPLRPRGRMLTLPIRVTPGRVREWR